MLGCFAIARKRADGHPPRFDDMAEWDIQSMARRCAVTGEVFAPGEAVVCTVYRTPEGLLERADCREELAAQLAIEGAPLARWHRMIPEKPPADDARQEQAQSAEDLFRALLDSPAKGDADARALLHFCALLLERRRVLKAAGPRARSGHQTYRHAATGERFEVPVIDLSVPALQPLADQLSSLIS